jgi:hypothetical protein
MRHRHHGLAVEVKIEGRGITADGIARRMAMARGRQPSSAMSFGGEAQDGSRVGQITHNGGGHP